MNRKQKVVVAGLGEIGKPLFQLLGEQYEVYGVDVAPFDPVTGVDVLHVCYPYQIDDFVGETARYIDIFHPALTIINSTVAIGTTRRIAEITQTPVVNSPIRGKHARMLEELRFYTKFVGAIEPVHAARAAEHFGAAGMKTKILSSPEATELAKLTETTYFGLLIAWAQEVERYCDLTGAAYDEVVAIYDEISYLPRVKFFPGVIGGHCVMPNIEILAQLTPSAMLDAIRASNDLKAERETAQPARAQLTR